MSKLVDPQNIEVGKDCPYCFVNFPDQYNIDHHIANDQCDIKKPSPYEKELLQRLIAQDEVIYAHKKAMTTVFNDNIKEVVTTALKSHSKAENNLQTTNYNLNVICVNTNNLTPFQTLSMENLMSGNSLPLHLDEGEEN